MPYPGNSTLQAIQTKVRLLARSVTEASLPTESLSPGTPSLNDYINTSIIYDLACRIRLPSLLVNFTFYTRAYIDTYTTNTTDPTDPLYDFKNKYYTVGPPVFIQGYQRGWTQSQSQFYGWYPKIQSQILIGLGDGVTTTYTGRLPQAPFLQNNVVFDAIDTTNNQMTLIDYPVSPSAGALGIPGVPQVLPSPYGDINYLDGTYNVNFPNPVQVPGSAGPNLTSSGQINAQVVSYIPSLPQAILWFNDSFVLRPVPDQAYSVEMQAYIRPTQLLSESDVPEIAQWWQYIAYLSAKKIFQDRGDLDSAALIEPELQEQETQVLRTGLVQMATQRTSTIYSENMGPWGIGNTFGWGSNNY